MRKEGKGRRKKGKEGKRWGKKGREVKEGNVPISSPIQPGERAFMSSSGGSLMVKRESLM